MPKNTGKNVTVKNVAEKKDAVKNFTLKLNAKISHINNKLINLRLK